MNRRKLHFRGFSVQPNGLREVEKARMDILALAWDVNIPRALRRRPSYLTPHMLTEIKPCINLIGLGKEYSALQAAWRQLMQLLKATAFNVRGIRRVGMARLKQGPFMSTGCGGLSGVIGGQGRGRICSTSYHYFSR